MADTVFLCGGDYTPAPRSECSHSLHDWPLPAGYIDRAETADRRMRTGWASLRCPRCQRYGWIPSGKITDVDVRIPAPSPEEVGQ